MYHQLFNFYLNLKTVFFDDFTAEMNDGGISNQNVVKAFREARTAKISTANISKPFAYFDFYFSLLKYYLSNFFRKISKSRY